MCIKAIKNAQRKNLSTSDTQYLGLTTIFFKLKQQCCIFKTKIYFTLPAKRVTIIL